MRTMNRNKTNLWYVVPVSQSNAVDSDGYETGEVIVTYSSPTSFRMSIFPTDSKIVEQIFGKDASFDMLGVSNEIQLDKNALIFLSEPTLGNYDRTYDYHIGSIKKSLNTTQYGLKRRV